MDADSTLSQDVGQLWRLFHDELWGFARRRLDSDAACDDVLQTAFLRAHQALADGRAPEEPRAWLYQIVRNLVRDTYRQRARQSNLHDAYSEEPTEHEQTLLAQDREAFEVVARALPHFIAALDEPYREALRLTELNGLTQADAAAQLQVTLSCMKARVRRGRQQIHAALNRCCALEKDRRGKLIGCAPRSGGDRCGSCS